MTIFITRVAAEARVILVNAPILGVPTALMAPVLLVSRVDKAVLILLVVIVAHGVPLSFADVAA